MHITCHLSRAEISSACGFKITQSTLGIEPFFSHLFVVNFSVSSRLRSSRCSKSETTKWADQSAKVLDGFHFRRCFSTKLVHFAHTKLPLGNRCIDIPSVFLLFLQPTLPGPPATQYFPRDFPFAWLFCVFDNRLQNERTSTTSDVILSIWLRVRAGQILLNLLAYNRL